MQLKKLKKIALIGCGPSGISVLAAFDEARKKGIDVPEIKCFEKQSQAGGLWNFNLKTGLDEHGEPVHGSMYKYLWSNAPKEGIEVAKYSYDEHFKKPLPSYPPRAFHQDYLIGRLGKIENKDVNFNTVVRNVEKKEGQYIVTYENLLSNTRKTESFNYVIVATGHYSIPNFPDYPGIESFNGRILHSHDFRNPYEFKDQTVLLVGSSYTAEDVSIQCYKYGAKKIIISCHNRPTNLKWPKDIIEVTSISHFDETKCYLTNGDSHEVDCVVFCTGYKHHYPFMADDLKLKDASNLMYFDHLYKGIFLEHQPNVMYIGPQDSAFTFFMFDIQAWYARDYILGKIKLPDIAVMKEDIKKWHDKRRPLMDEFTLIPYQRDYLMDLNEETNYCSKEVFMSKTETFLKWQVHRRENILTYRDNCFTSSITGTTGVPLNKPWLEFMDDSFEAVLNGCKK